MSVNFSEFKKIIAGNPFISPATKRELNQALAEGQTFYMVPASIPPGLLEKIRKTMNMKVVLVPVEDFQAVTNPRALYVLEPVAEKAGLRVQPGVIVRNEDEEGGA